VHISQPSRLSAILIITLLSPVLRIHAQAPIERQPPPSATPALPSAPTPSDLQWSDLTRKLHYRQLEFRVQAAGDPIRCTPGQITPTTLFCTEFRVASNPIHDAIFPPKTYIIPRSDIEDIRIGGREKSTAIGILIGMGAGAALGSTNTQSRAQGGPALGALVFGLIGGLVGHIAPAKGHIIYAAPAPISVP